MNEPKPTKLLNKNFVLLWQGQLVSLIGSQMHYIAMMFWVKHATGSAALMGTIMMLSLLPGVILGPIAGTFADRYSRRKIIILTDFFRGLVVLSLVAVMVWRPDDSEFIIAWIFGIAVLSGILGAFFRPAVSASVPDIVPTEKLNSANSMMQSSFELSRFIGQGAGGVLFRLLGAPLLFFIDGLSYIFSSISEIFIRIPQHTVKKGNGFRDIIANFKQDTIDGFKFAWKEKGLRNILIAATFLNFFVSPFAVLMPFYVEDFLGANSDWFGFIMAAIGIGTVIGFALAGTIKVSGRTRAVIMSLSLITFSLLLGVLGLVLEKYTAVAVSFCIGFSIGFFDIYIMTIIQLSIPSEMRGRVFGLMGTIAGGLYPIGQGLSGVISELTGNNVPIIFLFCGSLMAGVAIILWLSREYREYLAYDRNSDNGEAKESGD